MPSVEALIAMVEQLVDQGALARNTETINSVLVTLLIREAAGSEPEAIQLLGRIHRLSEDNENDEDEALVPRTSLVSIYCSNAHDLLAAAWNAVRSGSTLTPADDPKTRTLGFTDGHTYWYAPLRQLKALPGEPLPGLTEQQTILVQDKIKSPSGRVVLYQNPLW